MDHEAITDQEREARLQEVRKKIDQERSRLVNLAMQLEELGQTKERSKLFEAVRILDQWKHDQTTEGKKKKVRL